ncbi:MAG: hypothetical protein INQ03_08000 [Candidatus Heimdallarchaeota archaeon]|nr:hypothetical protein [Candidatus Heimdallarchaeota archaeon]
MPVCTECGSYIRIGLLCDSCTVDNQDADLYPPQREAGYVIKPYLLAVASFLGIGLIFTLGAALMGKTTNPISVFVILGISGSIFYVLQAYYAYRSFNDFRMLQKVTHENNGINPIWGVVALLIFPIFQFLKYYLLSSHLCRIHGGGCVSSPNPFKVMRLYLLPISAFLSRQYANLLAQSSTVEPFWSMVFSGFSSLMVFLTVFGLPMMMLMYGNSWQKALNDHIVVHFFDDCCPDGYLM